MEIAESQVKMEPQETSQEQSGCAVTKVKDFAESLGLKMEPQETSQEQQSEWTRVELKVEQDDHGEGECQMSEKM